MYTQQPGVHGTGTTSSKSKETWMPLTNQIVGCPPGLEYLVTIDRIQIIQAVDVLEAVIGWEVANRYAIINGIGQQIYYAFEESECCERQFCKQRRTFCLHIVDNFGKEVMTIRRNFNCCACNGCCACCACCQDLVTIESPPGYPIGSVHQQFGCCHPRYHGRDVAGQVIFNIEGPDCCMMSSCCDKVFQVQSNGAMIGEIRKRWGGMLKEAFTKADAFGVSFPTQMPVAHKAVMVGAAFFIDFMHFEADGDTATGGRGVFAFM